MNKAPKALELANDYRFRVVVDNNGTAFAGDLHLTPEGSDLVVRGDLLEDRRHDLQWECVDKIECEAYPGRFILLGLTGKRAFDQVLQRNPHQINHFEISYSVSEVIYSPNGSSDTGKYLGFDIHSPAISEWVGMTTTQAAIVSASENGTLFADDGPSTIEFEAEVPGGHVAIVYELTLGSMKSDFSIGLQYPPALSVRFHHKRSAIETIASVKEMETLFSFLLGFPLTTEKVQLKSVRRCFNQPSLYLTGHKMRPLEGPPRYPFFPLGRNLSHDQLGLPPLPLEVFPTYLGLPDGERQYVKKYLRYRQLENPEERFLGFFRLLEKLCHQQDLFLPEDKLKTLLERARPFMVKYFNDGKNVRGLVKGIARWNTSKLNTAGCLGRFMEDLPPEITASWRYKTGDLAKICSLRNDLTHANDVDIDVDVVESYAKFIEVLLVIKLLTLIGVPLTDAAAVSGRLRRHFWIESSA